MMEGNLLGRRRFVRCENILCYLSPNSGTTFVDQNFDYPRERLVAVISMNTVFVRY